MGMPGPTELFILFVLLLAAGIVVLLVMLRNGQGPGGKDTEHAHQEARQLLDERYARGELGRDEYQQMRRDMESD